MTAVVIPILKPLLHRSTFLEYCSLIKLLRGILRQYLLFRSPLCAIVPVYPWISDKWSLFLPYCSSDSVQSTSGSRSGLIMICMILSSLLYFFGGKGRVEANSAIFPCTYYYLMTNSVKTHTHFFFPVFASGRCKPLSCISLSIDSGTNITPCSLISAVQTLRQYADFLSRYPATPPVRPHVITHVEVHITQDCFVLLLYLILGLLTTLSEMICTRENTLEFGISLGSIEPLIADANATILYTAWA